MTPFPRTPTYSQSTIARAMPHRFAASRGRRRVNSPKPNEQYRTLEIRTKGDLPLEFNDYAHVFGILTQAEKNRIRKLLMIGLLDLDEL